MANKGRNIKPGELSLWQKMTQGIKAWHKEDEKGGILPSHPDPQSKPQSNPRPETKQEGAAKHNRHQQQAGNPPAGDTPPRQQLLDRRTLEKLSKGKMPIEGVLDLHGMTQAQAYSRLIAFITSSHHAGKRCVLVITGKGSRDTDDAGIVSERAPERGVLRSRLPEWLSDAPLNDFVLKHVRAASKHGGHGAFYVYLKNKNQQP